MGRDRSVTSFGGHEILLYDIKPADVAPRRVSRVLAKLCRWNGQTRDFWPIAQHLCFCSYIPTVPVEKLAAHVHDLHEAITTDVIKPVLLELGERHGETFLHELADRIDAVVEQAYGVQLRPHPEAVQHADHVSAVFEAIWQMEIPRKKLEARFGRDFVNDVTNGKTHMNVPRELLEPLSMKRAEHLWLARLAELQFEVKGG